MDAPNLQRILLSNFQIYSVVNGKVNVFISVNGINMNNILIEKGFGEFCEENFLSKVSHFLRYLINTCVLLKHHHHAHKK